MNIQQQMQIDVLRCRVWEKYWCRSSAWGLIGPYLYGYLGGQILDHIQIALEAHRRDIFGTLVRGQIGQEI